jgi:predicted nucleotidyltransferase
MVTKLATDPALVLFGQTRRRLLGWLFGHPDEEFYLRELLRQTQTPEGAAQRELAALTAAGLITRTVKGKQVYFQANRRSPVFPELSSLLTKTTGIAGVVREALAPLAGRIRVAFIYGSAARGALRQGSDIDLFVVGDTSFGEIVAATQDAERRLGREINPSVYSPAEFSGKLRNGHHFVTAVLGEPYLLIVGAPHDIERLGGAQQVADRPQDQPQGNPRNVRRRRPRSARQRRGRSER